MPIEFSLPFGDCGRRAPRRRYMTSSVSGGNSHGGKPPPKAATCKGCAKVKASRKPRAVNATRRKCFTVVLNLRISRALALFNLAIDRNADSRDVVRDGSGSAPSVCITKCGCDTRVAGVERLYDSRLQENSHLPQAAEPA